jgi:hypothetical protein
MGKYSCNVDGKVLDWKFTKSKASSGTEITWNFFLGETFIGQMVKARRSGWDPYVHHTRCPFGGLQGFATRYDAAEYMLKVCGFIKHPDQQYIAEMIDLEHMPFEFGTFKEFIDCKQKLKVAEEKLAAAYEREVALESQLSWAENPERMGN